ncbi:MAG: metallophosphoesterase [Ruminococcus sp.]|nr:metallophosphoesterase [Ruminococcus sp.]
MRILVVSDTHGDLYSLQKAVMRQPTAEVVIHCGDGEEQAQWIRDNFKDKMVISVKGNCDWGSSLNAIEEITLEGKKILITHGHLFNAKLTLQNLYYEAKDKKADILCFGHTHIPKEIYEDGIYMFNPGSCCGYNATYGYIDITPQGIVTNILKVM